eukprot:6866919-Prymnesium_polylepis.2
MGTGRHFSPGRPEKSTAQHVQMFSTLRGPQSVPARSGTRSAGKCHPRLHAHTPKRNPDEAKVPQTGQPATTEWARHRRHPSEPAHTPRGRTLREGTRGGFP